MIRLYYKSYIHHLLLRYSFIILCKFHFNNSFNRICTNNLIDLSTNLRSNNFSYYQIS